MSNFFQSLYVIFVLLMPIMINAQIWVARYNGPANGSDVSRDLAIDISGNIYVTGASQGLSVSTDYTTIKYYPNGDTAWVRRYDGPENDYDGATAVAVDVSGNVYVTGASQGFGTSMDFATIKYYPDGDTAWVRRYNGPVDGWDEATALAIDVSGNVYVTGRSQGLSGSADYATIKYYPNGDTAWVRTYNGPTNNYDCANAIALDSNGDVYVTGSSGGQIGDYVTVRYDSMGNEQWVAEYSGAIYENDYATAIAVDATGSIYVTGSSCGDYATVKYDSAGVEQWVAIYGYYTGGDLANGIAVDNAGHIYITGGCGGGYAYYATVKYDTAGTELWVAVYNGWVNAADVAEAITVDNAGNVYVTGWSAGYGTGYDYATVKYNKFGVEQWAARYNGPGTGNDEAYAIALDNSGNIFVTGKSFDSNTGDDYTTIKYSPVGIEESKRALAKENELITTIFSGSLRVPVDMKYRVFDITGRVVEPDRIQPGIYFLEIDDKIVQKVIKVR